MSTLLKTCWPLVLVVTVACGGSSSPTAPAPTLTKMTVAGSDLLLIGQSETFTAQGNTGALVTTASWGTDAPTVVSVEASSGRVTAVGAGTATIVADLGGIRGTKTIRTVPDFTGYWSGLYEQTGCEVTGDSPVLRGCPDSEYDFYVSEMKMRLTQDRDTVSGTFSLGGGRPETALVSGRASSDGTLTFTGTAGDSVVNAELQNVRFEAPRTGEMMTGTFELLYSSSTSSRSGTLRVFAKLRTMQGPQ